MEKLSLTCAYRPIDGAFATTSTNAHGSSAAEFNVPPERCNRIVVVKVEKQD
jgi:hypothetical protein